MSFALFLIYIAFLLIRPIELFELDFGTFRPMLALYALAFVAGAIEAFVTRTVASRPAHYWVLVGLIGAVGLSVAANGWFGGAPLAIEDFSVAAGMFVLATMNLTSIRRIRATVFTLLVSMLIVSSISLYSYHTGFMTDRLTLRVLTNIDTLDAIPEELQQREEQPGVAPPEVIVPATEDSGFFQWRMRYLGFLSDPNDMAQAMVLALPFLWFFHRRKSPFSNALKVWLPGAIMSYGVILTNSRGAIIGIAALFFFGLRSALGTMKTLLGVLALSLVVFIGAVGGTRGFSSSEDSAGNRIDLWYAGILMMLDSPVFGVGYGAFTDYADLTAHNSFVLVAAELGVIGFFFWVALIVLSYQGLGQTVRFAAADSTEHQMANLIRASLTGFLTCGWFLSRSYQSSLFLVLGIAVATWYCWARNTDTPRINGALPAPAVHWIPQTLVVMAGSLFLVYMFIQVAWLIR